jgi:putative ABC transport system ATP-binding protein
MSVAERWRAGRQRAGEAGGTRPPHAGAEVVVEDVVKSFGPIRALRCVSMTIAASEFVTINGPSGSGKSTLLNLIGSLELPDAGSITVGGNPVPDPWRAVEFRRAMVGFVFQDNLLLPYLSAQANVEAALMATGTSRRERRERSAELLAEVGLAERATHLPSELSGGQRQAVAIARALANRPRLLLGDEPTGALDSNSAGRALDLLASIRARHGTTLIVVSHDAAVAERADRMLHLVDGQLSDGWASEPHLLLRPGAGHAESGVGEHGHGLDTGHPPHRVDGPEHADEDADEDGADERPGREDRGDEGAKPEGSG